MTDDELVAAFRAVASTRQLPPPAHMEAVEDAERIIGFPIPSLLRRLYLEVANGGFGPFEGVLGVSGSGLPQSGNFADIADIYQDGPDPSGRIPAGLVLLFDWGCAVWSLVDFRDPSGPMWSIDNGQLFRQDMDLGQWLTRSLNGTLECP